MDESPSRGRGRDWVELESGDLVTIAGVALGILVITGFLIGLLF